MGAYSRVGAYSTRWALIRRLVINRVNTVNTFTLVLELVYLCRLFAEKTFGTQTPQGNFRCPGYFLPIHFHKIL